jgi:uncharacterized protein YlxW (UPF0749 family)
MFDAILTESYQQLKIASQIDKMQSAIKSDISAVYSNLDSLQNIKDTIDNTIKDTPKNIADAQTSVQTAEEKLAEKKLALDNVKAGADPDDIKAQEYAVVQKQNALLDARR